MADKLLLDILSGHVCLSNFQDWLTGKETKVINTSLNRTEFALVVLKYIQEETNKFLPTSSTSTTQESPKDGQCHEQKPPVKRNHENDSRFVEDEFSSQRTPFHAINKVTPTRTNTHQFARHLNNGYDLRQDVQQGSSAIDSRHIMTSTPVHCHRNSKGSDQFPLSPPGSYHSDQSSYSHTPRSSKSSRFNSSPGLHHFSPNSPQSPSFSSSSPQYSDSFPDLGARSRQRTPLSPCLGDFIKTKPASQKSRKRIKPTQLTSPKKDASIECTKGNANSFGTVNRPFVPITSMQAEVIEQFNFDEERNLLKQKRTQVLKSTQNNPTVTTTNITNLQCEEKQNPPVSNSSICLNISIVKSESNLSCSPQNVRYVTVEPDPSLVTNIDLIVRLASVYSACLDVNLVPNITSELHYVFTLLIATYKSKVSGSASSSKQSLLSDNTKESSSNSGHCNNLMQKLCLNENSRHDISSSVGNEETLLLRNSNVKSVFTSIHDCVMFSACVLEKQINTIQCFDKGTLRLLIENTRLSTFLPHLVPELVQIVEIKESKEAGYISCKESFLVENGPVLYQNETDNLDNFSSKGNFNFFKKQRDGFYETLHEWRTKNSDNLWISRRFPQRVQQLLSLSSDPVNMMHLARLFCAQMTSSKSEPQEELEMAGVSRDKLSRLQARFSKPAEEGGSPRPPPTFPAEQQFYQQFLQLAVGSTFLQHVTNCLVYRLHQLDHADFLMEGLTEDEKKSHIQAWVSSSCLIAKFLGLVTFLPYRSNTTLSPDVLQTQIMIREQVVPPVNLLPQLQRALASNRLVLTVPWVVAFLGMMDLVSPYLASYRPLLQLLASLYKALPLPNLSSSSNLFLRCTLGWLFDVSFFPLHVFSSLMSNVGDLEVKSGELSEADMKDVVVDHALLYEVCPYLHCLRQLLVPSSGTRQGTVRHITPVSAILTPTAASQTSLVQTVEMQLEECFLNGQSKSFRSTVEMIIDRISSSCNKHICSNIIAPAKEKFSEAMQQHKEELTKKEVMVWVAEQCQVTACEVEAAVAEHCDSKVGSALSLLLGPDLADPALSKTTHAICSRRCRERIIHWLNSHIKLTDVFLKLVPGPDNKPATDLMKPSRSRGTVEHRDTATAPADMIIELQDKLCECIERRSSYMSEVQVMDLIAKVLETVTHRSDLITVAEHTIFALTVDLCIVLLAHSPSTVTSAVISQLCAVWSTCSSQGSSQLERIMSARNTLLLCQGGVMCARESWQQLSLVLVELIRHSPPLLTPCQLESQCVALFRLDWPPMVLTLMGACLSSMLEKIKQDPNLKQKPKFVLMLEWVNEMTEDLSKPDILED